MFRSHPSAGVSDFRGHPVHRSTSGGWRSALFIIVVEIAGSFALFGVSSNLITYLTGPLGHSNAAAASAVNVWSGTASLMPLLGAVVADSFLGRLHTLRPGNSVSQTQLVSFSFFAMMIATPACVSPIGVYI
ncbi:hypothetical protein QYE76_009176 [Lolium multiflorum]|uniref:Nitrate transporter n=1 Tax=Lolium multiflorum TaxID=4521 RepID=A0AAD8X3B9_LOLMU|nr:hypothetical protein QYE76_009176 [Lolium multiflorum]